MTRDNPGFRTISQDAEITFRGRGRGLLCEAGLRLDVCPLCSQANTPRGAEAGRCAWCAYVPSLDDVEPVRAEDPSHAAG
jgi:hypothetical protein